jgi:hypothetical protein
LKFFHAYAEGQVDTEARGVEKLKREFPTRTTDSRIFSLVTSD